MKTLYLIGGPMGIGKTTAGRALQKELAACAFLDGDWCWDMSPFLVTPETKALVMDNICHILNGFLHCTALQNIVFTWVMHQQEILDALYASLDTSGWLLRPVSLVCRPECLRRRLEADIAAGLRSPSIIEKSLSYLPLYASLDTVRLDVSELSPQETALKLLSFP